MRTVNYFTGIFQQPIKLELLASGASVDVDSLAVIEIMRITGVFSIRMAVQCDPTGKKDIQYLHFPFMRTPEANISTPASIASK